MKKFYLFRESFDFDTFVVFAKIVRSIDNRSNEEYKVYSRKLQDTFKI